jgi:hypothetical protein
MVVGILVLVYLLMLQRFFKTWQKFYKRDNSMSPEEKHLSQVVLVVGAVLWPIVVPNAYLALLEKKLDS